MNHTAPARSSARWTPGAAAVVVAVLVFLVVVAPLRGWSIGSALGFLHDDRSALGEADGVVPDGVTVLDRRTPAVTRLDPALLAALRRAGSAAEGDGVELVVNSGWRSRAYQGALLREAESKYGSRDAAARWVATADTSPHVSGHAVDVGPATATDWLSRHGSAFGLCQVYGNEPWHYELRPAAVTHGCPPEYADPTHDPRMRP